MAFILGPATNSRLQTLNAKNIIGETPLKRHLMVRTSDVLSNLFSDGEYRRGRWHP